MQLKPQEMFVVVRQLGDPLDAGTYYVQAKIRNAHTDALIATLNLVNSGGQRFTKEWQVVADTSGEGFYVDVETIVYTDSGYSSVSDVYQRENAVYLVQDRQTPPFGGAGGGDVSYDKIRTIMTEVVEKAKPKESGKKPQKIDLTGAEKRILAAIKGVQEAVEAVEVPDNAPELKRLADASVEAKDAILKAIGDRAEFEPTDLSPVLERIEKAETTIAGKVGDAFTRMAKGFTGEIDTLREVATKLVNAFNGTLFMVAGPRPKDEKVEMPAPQRPERKRRMPGSAGFVSMAAVAIIGALSVAGFIGYGVYQNASPIAGDPTEVALGDTVSTLPQFTSTTSPSSAITQRTFGKAIKITGLSDGCLGLTSSIVTSSGSPCGSGGGGGSGGGPFSTTTNSLGIYNNVADQVVITDDNRTSTSTDGIIELERDAATTTIAFVATGINPAYRQGLDFWESTKNIGWLYDGSGTGDDNKLGLYDYTTGTMDFFINKGGGFLATGSSTINANATTTGMQGVGSLFINSERFTDLTGSGLTISSNALTVNDVTAAMLNAEDFGSFTCNGTSCTVDSQAITASMLANADFGDWTCSGGSCTIDANAIALGTDTTGNYVATVTSSGSITVGNSGSETAAVTVDLNMGNANTWTALQTFTNSSTTLASFAYASSTVWRGGGLVADCDTAATSKLLWDTTTGQFSCGTDQNSGGGGGSGSVGTSTPDVDTYITYFTTNSATPALIGGESVFTYDDATNRLTVESASTTNLTVATLFRPTANDGLALGSATISWSDLFLADGGVVNWGNGGVTLTHTAASDSVTWALDAANALGSTLFTWALDGANELILSASALYPSTDDGLALGIANTNEWADIFLNTGGVLNWANGDVTLTHGSGQLTMSADNFGVGTSTPWGRLGVTGADTSTTNALIIGNSADTPLLRVQNNGTTTISGITAATSTIYGFSTAASKGAVIILEDVDGAGCTEVSALNGVLSAITVTCPTEN